MVEKVQNASKPVENPKNNKKTDCNKDSDVFAALLTGAMGQNNNCLGNKTGGEITLDGETESALPNEIDNIKGLGYGFSDFKDQIQITGNLSAVDGKAILGDENLDAGQNINTQYGLIQNPSTNGEKGKLLEFPYIDLNSNGDSIVLNAKPDIVEDNKLGSKPHNSVDDVLYNTELEVIGGKNDIKDFIVPRAEFLKILNNNRDMKNSKMSAAESMAKDQAMDAETKGESTDPLSTGMDTKNKYNNYVEAEEGLNIDKKEEPEESKESKDKLGIINAKHMNTNEDSISQSQGTKGYDKVYQNVSFDKSTVMDQLYDKIKAEAGRDYTELHVKLKPEELGNVAIKLVMEKGVLTAKIFVEDTLVKAMIESNLPDLKEQLKNQNIDVSDFSVSLNLENNEMLNKGFQNGSEDDSRNAREMAYGKHRKGISVESNEDIIAKDVKSIIDGNLNMLI